MDFLSHVECSVCHRAHEPKKLLTVCARCGQMLSVRYHRKRAAEAVSKEELLRRPAGMYRFRELTPLEDGEEPVSLGEGSTPLLSLAGLEAHLGLPHLPAKDEGQNPTVTFKARGLSMAVTRARTLGVKRLILLSAGNAGAGGSDTGRRPHLHRRGNHRDRRPGRCHRRSRPRLVLPLDAPGALSSRGKEDDETRVGRAARLGGSRFAAQKPSLLRNSRPDTREKRG